MNLLKKIPRLALFAVLLILLLGVTNLQQQPLLVAFLLVMIAVRTLELLQPAPEGLIHWYRAEQHPRWIVWLSGTSFLTNLVLPILDQRYRGEVFWSSPLPQASWWVGAIGLVLFIVGSVLRLRSIVVVPPQKPEPALVESKRKKKDKASEPEAEPAPAPAYHLEPAFYHATALSYLGIAVCCTSLWGLLAILVVILPPLLHSKRVQTPAAA